MVFIDSFFKKDSYLLVKILLFFALLTRVLLLAYNILLVEPDINYLQILASGFINDLVMICYFTPFILLFRIIGNILQINRLFLVRYFWVTLVMFLLLFNLIGEVMFYDEFKSRYNFIAVDYLVYTHEIIGTLRAEINLELALFCLALISLLLTWFLRNHILQQNGYLKNILGLTISFMMVFILDYSYKPELFEYKNRYEEELSKNGLYQLFSAFRNNELDYDKFYIKQNPEEALNTILPLTNLSKDSKPKLISDFKKHNVVLILVESLSAEFLSEFGRQDNITPYLDKLSEQSMFFTNFYATGTRTVRGIEAVTMSVPPTPGASIVKRPKNAGLPNIADIFIENKYDVKFIYGGYSYFDNMRDFFSNNGYGIVDRSNLSSDEISFANIWGVADEDLFKLTIKEIDKSYAKNNNFFHFLLTTSNHRPYDFPDNRIDLKQGRRAASVKYTDYAIGEFLETAKTKPWFDNTIFIILADHCASSAGKVSLPVDKYHIPLFIYAPKIIKPQKINHLSSQIDVAPTLYNLLGYEGKFFGQNMITKNPHRAFMGTYQLLGYLKNDKLAILAPNDFEGKIFSKDDYKPIPKSDKLFEDLIKETSSFYGYGYYYYNKFAK